MACGLVTIKNSKVLIGIAIIVIIFILSLACSNSQAQTSIAFKPTDIFLVPAYNGSLSFAVNGTYSAATFENNTWTFTNLQLNGSQPLKNLEFSTQNSNVTIFSYLTFNNTAFQGIQLGYAVEGKGKQVLNLGLGSEEEDWEWSVAFNGVFIGEGDGWNILRDGTLVVTGATGNVSIFDFESFGNSAPSSNLPFYQQHSVAIIITVAVAATVVVAVVIKVNSRKHSGESS